MMKDKEVRIDTVEKLNQLLFEPEYQADIGRYRQLFVYRGLSNDSYRLVTSLQRCCKNNKDVMHTIEEHLLNNFAKYAEMEHPGINQSIWKKMIVGQHHGLPTRLMDWTRSPMIALHFATTENDMDQLDRHDCVVWRLDVRKLHKQLPDKYQNNSVFSTESLEKAIKANGEITQLQQYDNDMKARNGMVILEPPTIDQRIENQYSFFSVVPSHVESVEEILEACDEGTVVKYIIDRNLRWRIRDMLDEGNINERLVYPGLEGIAKWMSRHYHVRELFRLSISLKSITDVTVDAVICPTDISLEPVGSLETAIFEAAGRGELIKACKAKRKEYREPGDIVVTDSFNLKDKSGVKYIYHVLGYEMNSGDLSGSLHRLETLYYNTLEAAHYKGCSSVGFPLICSGTGGYGKKNAWGCALAACERFKKTHQGTPMTVFICVISLDEYEMGVTIRKQLEAMDDTTDLLKNLRLTEKAAKEFHAMAQRGVSQQYGRG